MNKLNIIIAITALVALCSCSGNTGSEMLPERNTAEVTSIIDGWNANCITYNFRQAYEYVTLGQLYKGSNFEADMDGMEEALAAYYGIPRDSINGTSTMGFAHFDDETIDVE